MPSTDALPPSSPATPSRSRFRSVKDMLPVESPAPSTGKLKRPNKNINSVLSAKSTNLPSPLSKTTLGTKNGKITGKSTKSSSTATISLTKSKPTIDPFDVFNLPSSSPDASPLSSPQLRPQPSPHETNKALDPYIPAKRIWTPVKENSKPDVIDLCTPDDVSKPAAASFTSLLNLYKHEELPSIAGCSTIGGGEPFTKRRCIEVLGIPSVGARKTSVASTSSKEDKPKSTKSTKTAAPKKPKAKKPKTITGLACAPYITAASPDATTSMDSPVDKPEEVQEETKQPAKPTRKKRQSTGVKKSTTTKKITKKAALPPPLSPQSARKRMDSQTFFFGTSSQCLQSNPPADGWLLETTGRKLNTIQTHAKMHSKAAYDLDGYDSLDELLDAIVPSRETQRDCLTTECTDDTTGWGISELEIAKGTRQEGGAESPGMWNKAARGLRGELHRVEVVDLVDEDDLDDIFSQKVSSQIETAPAAAPMQSTPAPAPTATKTKPKRQKKKDGDEPTAPPKLSGDALPAVRWTQLPTPVSTNPDPATQPAKPKPTAALPPSQKEDKAAVGPTQAPRPAAAAAAASNLPARPNFEGFTLLQLQTQIKQYGFKPVKSRNGMIDILNRCWDSVEATAALGGPEQPTALPTTATTSTDTTTTTTTAGKPRGRKKKQVDGDDVQDGPALPPKKRGRKPKAAASDAAPATVTTTTSKVGDGALAHATGAPTAVAAPSNSSVDTGSLFRHIATAIRQQPASGDLLAPSWWQRILMNETIELQELAEWLVHGAGGVGAGVWEACGVVGGRAGKLAAVRDWCEARSVSFAERE
ncbi:hypothetical protein Dda_0575 [Drechslerella dactyloides]|uniref:Structure-specific endonuclease subunit SLX4 n=1 Tax=Drechslerella dactyloides TaxID=74499 RepID=A0AAD6NMS5_DREDA|nr:hypothetical protein Dda_0575 [Drechslerella dactyloides]